MNNTSSAKNNIRAAGHREGPEERRGLPHPMNGGGNLAGERPRCPLCLPLRRKGYSFGSSNSATDSRRLRIWRFWGHFSSQAPHFTQALALAPGFRKTG